MVQNRRAVGRFGHSVCHDGLDECQAVYRDRWPCDGQRLRPVTESHCKCRFLNHSKSDAGGSEADRLNVDATLDTSGGDRAEQRLRQDTRDRSLESLEQRHAC